MQTNFFVVFPEGVLEEAPQFFVILTRSENDQQAAAVQSAVVASHPNVSAIDLTLVLSVFDAIYSRISFVLRFMALFSILTGIIVLISAVTVSRYQRISESVLLKTLGASRAQIVKILFVEYLFLGMLAALTGILLALICGWLLSLFVFQTAFVPSPVVLVLAVVLVTSLTVLVGMANSRGIYAKPPLQVLRAEMQ
jgi:putative ABC transport system permease protein